MLSLHSNNARLWACSALVSINALTLYLWYTQTFNAQPPDSHHLKPPASLEKVTAGRSRWNQIVHGSSLEDSDRRKAFDNIYATNMWAAEESASGTGSTVAYTSRVRHLIDYTVDKFNLKYMVDAPCGDCNWQTQLGTFFNLSYTGVDIVSSVVLANARKHRNFPNARFLNLDLVQDSLPPSDFYLVRDCIQHLPFQDGIELLKNVEASGAKYLITNFHVKKNTGKAAPNVNVEPGGYFGINVMAPPYNFRQPLYYILDQDDDTFNYGSDDSDIKLIGVWKLPVLNTGIGRPFTVDFEEAKEITIPPS